MELDDDLCVCFHVSRRKLLTFLRVQTPRRAGQLAECLGAGTGCGWCRPFLRQLFEAAQDAAADPCPLPAADDYRAQRAAYLSAGRGSAPPPGPPPAAPQRPTGD